MTAVGVDGRTLALRLLREGLHVKLISDRTALMPKEIADVARRNGMTIDEDGVPHIARPSAGKPPVPTPQRVAEVVQIRPAVRDLLVAARRASLLQTCREHLAEEPVPIEWEARPFGSSWSDLDLPELTNSR